MVSSPGSRRHVVVEHVAQIFYAHLTRVNDFVAYQLGRPRGSGLSAARRGARQGQESAGSAAALREARMGGGGSGMGERIRTAARQVIAVRSTPSATGVALR